MTAPLALIFDTETSDLVNFKKPADDASQPWPVEVAWQIVDTVSWKPVQRFAGLVALPKGVEVSEQSFRTHGITAEQTRRGGLRHDAVFNVFAHAFLRADFAVCHSWNYDRRIMASLACRSGHPDWVDALKAAPHVCTMMSSTNVVQIPGKRGGYKWPTLAEAYGHFTGDPVTNAHSAMGDVRATTQILRHLLEGGHVDVPATAS